MDNGLKYYVDKIKEMWKNPRGRAIIKLSFYFVFFFLVISMLRSNASIVDDNQPATITPPKTVIEIFSLTKRYNSIIKINDKEYRYVVGDNKLLTIDGITYLTNNTELKHYSEDNKELDIPVFDIYFWNLTPELIGNVTSNGKLMKKTTTYDDDKETLESTYSISLQNFLELFAGKRPNLTDEQKEELITFTLYEINRDINNVKIDLTIYNKLLTGSDLEYNVDITYYKN